MENINKTREDTHGIEYQLSSVRLAKKRSTLKSLHGLRRGHGADDKVVYNSYYQVQRLMF